MKLKSVILTAAALAAFSGICFGQEAKDQHDARMQWWREARFGMFVHWGLYSGLAGTWNGKPVGKSGGMEWIQQRVGADTETYAKAAIPLFKPTPDFAKGWARMAKDAGCRYLVFTTKHHDGFCLADTKVSDYDAGSVLHRDLVKEIVEACHAEGLRVGFYHSVIDWHHDQYEYAKSKQLPHPLKGKPYPKGMRDHAKYLEYLFGEVGELMSNYGAVDVLWWDYSAQDFQGDEAWHATELMKLVREKQPNIIMNNRLFRSAEAGWKSMGTDGFAASLDTKYGDFITPEQHIPANGMPGVDWETCMTMNTTWGYSEHDHAWKSDETLIKNLVDIASKGGNYLLNIGPKGDGSVPEESVKSLAAIGAWMKINSEAIYGTTANPLPADLAAPKDAKGNAIPPTWRCTAKAAAAGAPAKLYVHLLEWPKATSWTLNGVAGKVAKATLLADPDKKPLAIKQDGSSLTIELPANAPGQIVNVIRLDLGA